MSHKNLLPITNRPVFSFIKVSFLLLILTTVIFFGCSDNEDREGASNATIDTKYYAELGTMHNQELEYYYTQLKGLDNSAKKTMFQKKSNTLDKVNQIITNRIKSLGLTQNEENIGLAIVNSHSKVLSTGKVSYNLSSKYSHKIYEEYESQITSNQKQVLDELQQIIENHNATLNQMLESITELEMSASSKLNEKELVVIYSVTAVAKASLTYWSNNYTKWKMLKTNNILKTNTLKETAPEKEKSYGWGDAAADDIAGGVGGAVAGGIGGAYAGAGVAGVGAVPGAVSGAVTGAIAGAAGNSVQGWVRSWFN